MTDDQFPDRLRYLLVRQADQLTQDAPALSGPLLRAQAERTRHRARCFVTPVLAAAAVLALFLLPLLVSRHDGPGPRVTPAGPGTSVVVPVPGHRPTVGRSVTTPVPKPTFPPRTLYVPSMTPSVQTPTGAYPTSPTPVISSLPAPSATSG